MSVEEIHDEQPITSAVRITEGYFVLSFPLRVHDGDRRVSKYTSLHRVKVTEDGYCTYKTTFTEYVQPKAQIDGKRWSCIYISTLPLTCSSLKAKCGPTVCCNFLLEIAAAES